jgi:acyl-coenzyme A synthetase/AMP-(fatty) acid ligase
MMGAVLHTINVRLSPEQILYTINHAEDDVILANVEFLPVLHEIWERVERGKKLVLLDDGPEAAKTPNSGLTGDAEYDGLLAASDPHYAFPQFDENTRATTFYTTGTTGLPKAYISASVSWFCIHWPRVRRWRESVTAGSTRATSICPSRRCSMFMPGAFRMPLRRLGSSRSTRAATRPIRS